MALNSHGKQNTWDSIHFTYFQVWGKSIVRLKYKVVVVTSPKCVCAVWDNTIPSAVPWLCSGCFKFGLRRQVFADKLRIFSLCLYALLMLCLSFLVFQKQSIPTASSNKDRETYTPTSTSCSFSENIPPATSSPAKVHMSWVQVASFPSIFQSEV